MKTNTKHTALELVLAAGFKEPVEFGKIRVRVAGIAGIIKPDHLINIQPGTKEIEVMVGEEVKKLEFDGDEKELAVSDGAEKALKVKGEFLHFGDDSLLFILEELKTLQTRYQRLWRM